ncbi:MAG: peptide chain release factor N(5)-glutamine methyltransferase [Lachnospiraceae bacterium]|nr:peptide chain release factor N(5)-glutamine methyltransferase [Lachnospiraceae bacterium]
MRYKELYELGCLKLKAADISDYKTDARLLLEAVMNTSYNDLFVKPLMEVDSESEEKYNDYLALRAKHTPLQHITGKQGFMGLEFKVSSDVLVPRQDTENLVEEVLKDLHDGMHILDMCTGSGCILLSLLKYSNDCTGVGVDISEKALAIAKENAENLGINSAEFIQSDLFENVKGKFDILVSNPPYIRTCEIENLMPEVRDHDPFIALNGHESGVYFYEKIIDKAGEFLKRGSLVAFEIGNDEGREVMSLMKNAGYKNVEVIKDYGGNDRVVKGYFAMD